MDRRNFITGGIGAIIGGFGFSNAHSQLDVSQEFLHKLSNGFGAFVTGYGDKRYAYVQAFEEGKTYFLAYGLEDSTETVDMQQYKHTRLKKGEPLILRINIENTQTSPIERFEDRNLNGIVDAFAVETIDKAGMIHEKPIDFGNLSSKEREVIQLKYERGLRALTRKLPYR